MNYFVTAIDTNSGKTLVSAILCEALQADYWKPVQAGLPRDADTVKSLVSNSITKIHPEKYLLRSPMSPHAAAKRDGVIIKLSELIAPQTNNKLIIEGAGGCMVPLNDSEFILDLIVNLQAKVILVSDIYLGSINHTLLTVQALANRKVHIEGIIFNGVSNPDTESIILHHTNIKCLMHLNREEHVNKATVKRYAEQLKNSLS